jgi:SPP1 gp7 family putative phage head morphogenesis protein
MPKKPRPELQTIINRAVVLAAPLYAAQAAKWVEQVQRMKSRRSKIKLKISKDIRELFELIFTVIYMFGRDVAADEIEALKQFEVNKRIPKGVNFAIKDGQIDYSNAVNAETGKLISREEISHIASLQNFAVWQRVNWDKIGFQAALDRFLAKKIISAKDFKDAEAAIKAIAFSVQRVEEANALIVLKESIAASIKTGATFKDWKDELPSLFENAGYVVKGPKLTPWHLETVFRTNQASVYEAGKWDQFQSDDYVTGMEYVAVMDNRTRVEHAALDGEIFKKDDPIWGSIYPPNEYNCRCSTSPVSNFYMREKGLKWSTQTEKVKKGIAGVDEDFTGKNGLLGLDDRIQNVLDEKFEIIKEIKL